jgi:hypothetical protein
MTGELIVSGKIDRQTHWKRTKTRMIVRLSAVNSFLLPFSGFSVKSANRGRLATIKSLSRAEQGGGKKWYSCAAGRHAPEDDSAKASRISSREPFRASGRSAGFRNQRRPSGLDTKVGHSNRHGDETHNRAHDDARLALTIRAVVGSPSGPFDLMTNSSMPQSRSSPQFHFGSNNRCAFSMPHCLVSVGRQFSKASD